MAHQSKRFREIAKMYEIGKSYTLQEAVEILKKCPPTKFDQSLELSLKTGVEAQKSDQQVRGTVSLPNGTGKKVVLIVFARGEKIQEALDAGAAYVIVDEPVNFLDNRLIETEDTLQLLQDLAKFHRQQFTIPFIAITGSNSKTTTKELINEVLASTYKTYCTKGHLNNHIGIPLTILAVKKDAEISVIEMGANHQKEIESYCQYTLPTHGIITNCGKAHLEGFGGEQGVIKGKGELFDYLKITGGTAFIMNDYDYLKKISVGISSIKT